MNIENEVSEILRRVETLEKRSTPARGPAGDVVAAERAIGSRITESSNTLKAAADTAAARTKELNDTVDVAVAKINAIAERVEVRLKSLDDRLSSEDLLELAVIQTMTEYQLLKDGDVGDLLKYHIEKHVAGLTPEVKQ
jgi:hypothetical protein